MIPGRMVWRLIACLSMTGCLGLENGARPDGEVDGPANGQMDSQDCLFGLCLEAIPGDTAGQSALAARVADSALASGLKWLRESGAGRRLPPAFRWIKADSLGFSLEVSQYGLFPRLDVAVRVQGAARSFELKRMAIAGQNKSLAGFPALGQMNYEGNLVLAGTANIHGPVLLWRGGVGVASDFYVRYEGQTPKPAVWKSESPLWKTLPFTFPGAMDWFSAQDSILRAAPADMPAEDPWFADLLAAGSVAIGNRTFSDLRIVAPGGLVLGDGLVLRNCAVIAASVRIEGDARIENSLIFGRDSLIILGSPSLTGQFLSRDSIHLNVQSVLAGYPIFYVNGNPARLGGRLHAAKARGEAILFYGGDKTFPHAWGYQMVVDDSVSIKGLIYANGICTMDGTLEGSAIMEKNMFLDQRGTTYSGFIRKAQLRPPDPAMILSLPLLIEPYDEILLRSESAGTHGTP